MPAAQNIRFLLLVLILLSPLDVNAQEKIPPGQLEFFEKRIRPVLVSKCYSCHAKDAKSIKGGLALDTRESIRAGGDSGHAVVPGDIDSSLIMEAIRYESFEMPPKEQLPESVIEDFAKWIEMGAPDPRKGPSLIKRVIDFEVAKKHWSFQPIRSPNPPVVENNSWPRSEIDQFVMARLEARKLRPVADAERLTLVRRLYYDLTGLPPTPVQLAAAIDVDSPQSIENLVDSLLESPQFGERWGRHWLDVVRYAESNGRERNFVYPNAWRYRDYVIAAFNSDKPFDQFIHEQIAGDLLVDPQNEQLIATGFLAIGPKLLNENNRNAFVMDMVDEQIDITTRAFMGLTVSCARCHDHKFDPIPTAEYYSMAGIFRSTQTLYGTKKQQGNRQGSDLIPLDDPENNKTLAAKNRLLVEETTRKLEAARSRLASLQKQSKQLAQRNRKNKSQKDSDRAAELKSATTKIRKRVSALQKELKEGPGQESASLAMGVREGKVADSPIYIRGEASSPKGSSPRGFLTILDPHLQQPLLDTPQSGRMELANWITSEQNTLTPRVIVNRVWHHLFGTGLVRTVDNFGTSGEPPTHPELLDFLATRFVEQGWSIKKLVREIVLTRTYQLSGTHVAANYDRDPDNLMLWRHDSNRVDAESLRDAMLLASGQLDLRPAVGSPVSKLNGEYGRGVSIGEMAKNNTHRSVYLPIIRNAVPEPLKLFDFAEPSILVGERPVTTVPTQALFFLNSNFVINQCDSLTEQLLSNGDLNDDQRVDQAYRSVLARPANPSEIKRAKQYIRQTSAKLASNNDALSQRKHAWSGFCQALFGSAEFRYVE